MPSWAPAGGPHRGCQPPRRHAHAAAHGITNLWVSDLWEAVQVGEGRPVEIVSLQRDELGRVVGAPVEVRCPIRSNHAMELMGLGDSVKGYIRAIHDGVPTGAILKVLKKKVRPGL